MLTPEEIDQIPGWFTEAEGWRLYELAKGVPHSLPIVEVGSYVGRSTCWLANGSRSGQLAPITCIDPWLSEEVAWYSDLSSDQMKLQFEDTITRGGYWDIIEPLRATSQEVATHWDRDIGLLFIDSVHEYQPVLDDWDAWTPNIPVGSWIAFHDVTHVFPGVGKAIAERWTPERWSEPVQVESLWTARRIK